MSVYFLDSSALAKRYLEEKGTLWVRTICNPLNIHVFIVSTATRVEIAAAIGARWRDQSISESERIAAYRLLLLHCTSEYQLIPSRNCGAGSCGTPHAGTSFARV